MTLDRACGRERDVRERSKMEESFLKEGGGRWEKEKTLKVEKKNEGELRAEWGKEKRNCILSCFITCISI